MNKKLKFGNLASPRYTRSMKNKVTEITNSVTKTSEYFGNSKDAKRPKATVKKRIPIKVEYEAVPETEIKPQTPPIKVENEIVPKIEIKQEISPVKVEVDEVVPKIEIKQENSPVKVEVDEVVPKIEIKQEISETKTKVRKSPKTASSKSRGTQSNDKWEPENWQLMLSNIQEMRKGRTAPVDQMGCHRCCDPEAPEPVARFQALVALMLSSQTKDQVTFAAMQRLRSHGCTPTNIISTSNETLGKLIHPVGFWRRKVEYIKRTTEILLAQYDGDIPKTIDGLCKLPGVGPKMGHICMQVAWGEVSGIGVDTHLHRISNRIGWVRKQTKAPEETRVQLESWLPKEKWTEINHILVGFGQEICLPLRPKCGGCLNRNICPYAKSNRTK